ncbi:LprI family protein [Burkholderia arboris]|uniref:lysozyme inhibitor LprI family protein n=1 Tax=Burkholderia arboris TaxID=488730 RepID=UPI001CA3B0E7|nr:lysozyme inhibitor LprI family protein [Burkholderia arboris]MBY8607758.1 LprI family protein [Burkholderia arboris]
MATHGRFRAMRAALAALVVWAAGAAGLAGSGVAHAEVAAADPIDVAMRQCLARRDRSSPAGQIQCMGETQQQWQAVMDGAYQRLLKDAPADAKRGWQDSQRHWLTWRKDEVHLLKAVYDTTRGTAYAMSSADLQLQPVRDRALALRGAADRYAPQPPAAVPVAATSGAQGGTSAAQGAAAAPAGGKPANAPRDPAVRRVRLCAQDAACEHAIFDLNRYYQKLRRKMPAHSAATLVRAQRAWVAFRDATAPLVGEDGRVDLIGARIATMKRLSETAGNQ